MPIIIFKNCYQLVIEEKGQHLKNMVFILPMLTHIIPIWIKDNLILMQSWIMIWLRCLRLCGIQNKIVNMDWNFIIAHVPIQKNMFCSNNFNFSQHLFLFFAWSPNTHLHKRISYVYIPTIMIVSNKKKCIFWFHKNNAYVSRNFSTTSYSRWCSFWLVFELYREISSTTSSLFWYQYDP